MCAGTLPETEGGRRHAPGTDPQQPQAPHPQEEPEVTDQNTTSMSQQAGIRRGDRVRIVLQRQDLEPEEAAPGDTGTVIEVVGDDTMVVSIDRNGDHWWFSIRDVEPLEPTASDLIAIAEQCGAVEHNRYVDDGMLCRRFITPDGSIDLTVRVP